MVSIWSDSLYRAEISYILYTYCRCPLINVWSWADQIVYLDRAGLQNVSANKFYHIWTVIQPKDNLYQNGRGNTNIKLNMDSRSRLNEFLDQESEFSFEVFDNSSKNIESSDSPRSMMLSCDDIVIVSNITVKILAFMSVAKITLEHPTLIRFTLSSMKTRGPKPSIPRSFLSPSSDPFRFLMTPIPHQSIDSLVITNVDFSIPRFYPDYRGLDRLKSIKWRDRIPIRIPDENIIKENLRGLTTWIRNKSLGNTNDQMTKCPSKSLENRNRSYLGKPMKSTKMIWTRPEQIKQYCHFDSGSWFMGTMELEGFAVSSVRLMPRNWCRLIDNSLPVGNSCIITPS